ncbi:MAG: fumarylacetoacetate hydrolase family protein, partial [Bacillota bacterium]|nr:fumarylacetoacetate hydrolase family protein [Bacillota bacterium]
MKIVRFFHPTNNEYKLGLVQHQQVIDLTIATNGAVTSLVELMTKLEEAPDFLNQAAQAAGSLQYTYQELDREPNAEHPYLVAPVDPVEVWACGVTYKRSMEAREKESNNSCIYDKVYHAVRPELFFKATGARVRGPQQTLGLRNDSTWMVPEPELGLVIDSSLKVVGFTIGNDLSCRDIEGENPLYLPQAKMFRDACSIGPAIMLTESVE